MVPSNLLDSISRFLSRKPVYHGLFWLLLFGLSVLNGMMDGMDWRIAFGNELISLVFYVIIVYINLLYLVPQYMARNALLYLLLVVALCALFTPLRVLFLYIKFHDNPIFQADLIKKQGYLFLGNLLVVAISTVLRIIMDWRRYQDEKKTLLTQTMQSELRFLKSQINPHFLFNTLNNLYALTLKKSDKAPEIVLKLSEIMRYMLYECNEKRVLLSKEIQYMQNYLDLERLRQPADAEINFDIQGHLSDQQIAPLLFIPFLENAFKHGLNHHLQGGGKVHIRINVAGDDLEFQIENSKVGNVPRKEHPRSGGIGLVNVRQRLELLYPGQHDLQVEDNPDRFVVTLLLTLEP